MKKTITISSDINDNVKAYAKSQGITHSQAIEIALRAYFKLYDASMKLAEGLKEMPTFKNNDK